MGSQVSAIDNRRK